MQVLQNGPNRGRDVFIPLDHVIGGIEQAGKGWKMLMSALAAGRPAAAPQPAAPPAAAPLTLRVSRTASAAVSERPAVGQGARLPH